MLILFYTLVALSLLTMLFAVYQVFRLRKIATGGKVGRVVKLLGLFIGLFLLGYGVAPWLPELPPEISYLLTSGVFFMGAIFVVIVLRVIENLVTQVFEELGMQ